jgi:hypothetical protein
MNHIILDNDLILGQNIAYSKAGLTREVLFALVGSAVLLLINGAMYYYGYYMWSAIIVTIFLFFYSNISTFQTPLAIQNTFYDADIHDIAQKINQKINL